MTDPRALAAELVNAVLLDGHSLSERLAALRAGTDGRALAAAQSLAYGTLRAAGRLRFFLRQLAERPLDPPDLAGFLLVGLHELDAELSPAYAAVNETVATAARRFPRARGFVNAVLRNFQRRREELAGAALSDDEAHWNFPRWWLNRLRAEYPQAWQGIVDAQNRHPPMTLRVNRRQTTLDAYRDELAHAGIEHRQTGDMAVTLTRPLPVAELPGFADGQVSVQDLGAQWAAPLLGVADGMRVLDACAAPGGKTGHLLELADLDLLALDGDALRLGRVRDNLERLRLRAELFAADAGEPARWWDGRAFDRILLDAPCTASGVARRHPDGKWLKRAEDMQHLAREQSRLLAALWPLLRPGGRMLYATCSLFRAENAGQVADFLSRHPDAALESIAQDGAREGQIMPDPDTDGFFYARLRKT
jgi:16S rRNA (cytosine967-C5)-methyltransferase